MVRSPHFRRLSWVLLLLLLPVLLGAGFWCLISPQSNDLNPSATSSGYGQTAEAHQQDLTVAATAPLKPSPHKTTGEDLRAGRNFTLVEDGRQGRFRLALDEIYDARAPVHQRLRKIPAQASATELLNFARAEAERLGKWPGLVIYPEEGPPDAIRCRVLTADILLTATDANAAKKLATDTGLKVTARPAYAPQHLVASAPDPLAAVDALAALGEGSGAMHAEPLLMRQRSGKVLLNDPYLQDQWHLKNTGQVGGKTGIDIGIENVWRDDTVMNNRSQGQNIRIAIVDQGVELDHPDLAPNADSAPNHYDWNGEDNDPSPESDHESHGTAVAGVVAARGNNGVGISGVAPQATLIGFRLIADFSDAEMESNSVLRGNDVIHIKNNSWGNPDGYPFELGYSSPLMTAAMATAAETGRGGLGTISVWAAGNGRQYGDQGNKDAYGNSIYGITVGAVNNKGKLTVYSETGSHLTVVAPSAESKAGIVTTDLTGIAGSNSGNIKNLSEVDYTNAFNGTSAAAPIVSGVVALMLQANPELNWRDVKEILLRSSTKIFPNDKGWVQRVNRDEWEASLPVIKHHQSYGGGLIHAPSAVAMARNWPSLGAMVTISRSEIPPSVTTSSIPTTKGTTIILDPLPEENKPKILSTRINVDFSDLTAMRVENVSVKVNAAHNRRGDLTLKLISPSGTVSTLASASRQDTGADYVNWTFSSMRHWGESSRGVWSIVASEPDDEVNGIMGAVTITLHGTAYPAITLTSAPESQIVSENSPLTFNAQVTPFFTTTRQWYKQGKLIPGATGDSLGFASAQLGDAGLYTYTVENLTGREEAPVSLAVVRTSIPSQQVLPGKTVTFKVTAAGPDLRYQWFFGSEALRDDGRITGSRSATLRIKKITAADANDYFCRVSMGDLELNTLLANLSIAVPPSLDLFEEPAPGIVSGWTEHPIQALNGATRYRATGLPPGVKVETSTGTLIGRPTKPGMYTVTLIASNTAGSSAAIIFTWEVEDLPPGTLGTYRGLVERYDLYNQGMGGSFTLTITKTGLFTGTLTQGKLRSRFKGTLDTYAGETFSTGTVSIPQPAKADPLSLTFSLENGRLDGSVGRDVDEEYTAIWALRQWTALPEELASLPGRYNLPLVSDETSSIYPLGSGFVSLTVAATGRMTYTGRLADGTALTGGGHALDGGILPLHHMLYKNTGSVQGRLTLAESQTAFAATLDWFKASVSASRSYPAGFPAHPLTGEGGLYTPPLAGSLLLNLASVENNARLDFTQGGLFTPFSQTFTLVANNKAVFPAGTGNPHGLKLTLNAKTGLLTGKGTAMDIDPVNPSLNRQRAGSSSGLIIPELDRAEGYFLLPEDSGKTAPILSGSMRMLPAGSVD